MRLKKTGVKEIAYWVFCGSLFIFLIVLWFSTEREKKTERIHVNTDTGKEWKIEEYSEGSFFSSGNVSFWMNTIPEGTYTDRNGKKSTIPEFHLGRFEVTQDLWLAIMGTTEIAHEENKHANYPIYGKGIPECMQFLKKMSLATGFPFRFPTEDEWMYAATGGPRNETFLYSGGNIAQEVAVCRPPKYPLRTYNISHVASKRPNSLGLFDMSGNVSEWVDAGGYYIRIGGDANYHEDELILSKSSIDANKSKSFYGLRLAY